MSRRASSPPDIHTVDDDYPRPKRPRANPRWATANRPNVPASTVVDLTSDDDDIVCTGGTGVSGSTLARSSASGSRALRQAMSSDFCITGDSVPDLVVTHSTEPEIVMTGSTAVERLSYDFHPHIVESVVLFAPISTQITLRAVCRDLKQFVDRRLPVHIVVDTYNIADGGIRSAQGCRVPALAPLDSHGRTIRDSEKLDKLYPRRLRRNLGVTQVLDIRLAHDIAGNSRLHRSLRMVTEHTANVSVARLLAVHPTGLPFQLLMIPDLDRLASPTLKKLVLFTIAGTTLLGFGRSLHSLDGSLPSITLRPHLEKLIINFDYHSNALLDTIVQFGLEEGINVTDIVIIFSATVPSGSAGHVIDGVPLLRAAAQAVAVREILDGIFKMFNGLPTHRSIHAVCWTLVDFPFLPTNWNGSATGGGSSAEPDPLDPVFNPLRGAVNFLTRQEYAATMSAEEFRIEAEM